MLTAVGEQGLELRVLQLRIAQNMQMFGEPDADGVIEAGTFAQRREARRYFSLIVHPRHLADQGRVFSIRPMQGRKDALTFLPYTVQLRIVLDNREILMLKLFARSGIEQRPDFYQRNQDPRCAFLRDGLRVADLFRQAKAFTSGLQKALIRARDIAERIQEQRPFALAALVGEILGDLRRARMNDIVRSLEGAAEVHRCAQLALRARAFYRRSLLRAIARDDRPEISFEHDIPLESRFFCDNLSHCLRPVRRRCASRLGALGPDAHR